MRTISGELKSASYIKGVTGSRGGFRLSRQPKKYKKEQGPNQTQQQLRDNIKNSGSEDGLYKVLLQLGNGNLFKMSVDEDVIG